MKILSNKYFERYRQQLKINISDALAKVRATELTQESFTFYTSIAVISSSRIEGEQMEADSYIKHKMQGVEYLPELTQKPNNLFDAYLFAKYNQLTKKNFCKVMCCFQNIYFLKNGGVFFAKTKW